MLMFELSLCLLAVCLHFDAQLLDQSSIVDFLMSELRFSLSFGCVQLFAQSGYLLLTFDLELCFLCGKNISFVCFLVSLRHLYPSEFILMHELQSLNDHTLLRILHD